MQSHKLKLNIIHKLDWQIAFHNQNTKVFKELFMLHIILCKESFTIKHFETNAWDIFGIFLLHYEKMGWFATSLAIGLSTRFLSYNDQLQFIAT
jgi:hypothetical protein